MDLKAKVGPLPVYAWGLILGVAIVGFVWFSRLKGGASASTSNPSEDEANAGLTGWRDSSGLPVSTVSPVNTGDVGNVELTNATWLAQGVKYAQSLNYLPLNAEIALRKYLEGQKLDPIDAKIVNAVNAKLGLPPQGVNAIPTQSGAKDQTPVTPPLRGIKSTW